MCSHVGHSNRMFVLGPARSARDLVCFVFSHMNNRGFVHKAGMAQQQNPSRRKRLGEEKPVPPTRQRCIERRRPQRVAQGKRHQHV